MPFTKKLYLLYMRTYHIDQAKGVIHIPVESISKCNAIRLQTPSLILPLTGMHVGLVIYLYTRGENEIEKLP